MRTLRHKISSSSSARGSVLVLVIWIIFGLISITLYFGHSMAFELRASDNRVSGQEAEQVIEGARRYLSLMLSNNPVPGSILSPATYQCAAVPIGNGEFWLIGRTNVDNAPPTVPTWGLVDEASKINLNTATSNMLMQLSPRMTPDIVLNIIAWRNSATNAATMNSGGAESVTYTALQPAYTAKNAPFESLGELRLIYNMDMPMLYGEDANLNGILDPNENDGEALPPADNQDGKLDPGILEYLTIYSREPSTTTNGTARFNLTTAAGVQALYTNMAGLFGDARTETLFGNAQMLQSSQTGGGGGGGGRTRGGAGGGGAVTYTPAVNAAVTCPLLFYVASQMTPTEFSQVETSMRGASLQGLINVNTASTTVLACIDGMDINTATQITGYRQANQSSANNSNTVAWVSTVIIDRTVLAKVAPYLTGQSYQFTADIAALGHDGRGYRRTRFVYDTTPLVGATPGPPTIIYRQDLTHLGWALGKQVRDRWVLGKKTP